MLPEIGYGAAGLAGFASFLTPCILPIVPFYLCYISGLSFPDLTARDGPASARRPVVFAAVMFALGMSLIFIGLGAAATQIGQELRAYAPVLRYFGALLILVMGLHFLGVMRLGFMMREARTDLGDRPLNRLGPVFGPLLIGMAFAFGWSPCAGPILAGVLFKASEAETVGEGVALLGAYSAGMTLPFVLAALFVGPFLAWAKGIRRHMARIEKAIGAMMILFAILLVTGGIQIIATWMLRIAPDMGLAQ